ncbi:MAG: isoleucine--tRNA ligase [Candidatus Micrarchaeota archaeon]|nr:MAG: isoleucine--tRNA ligase [Candidatus Micrarchaeota archaeon]
MEANSSDSKNLESKDNVSQSLIKDELDIISYWNSNNILERVRSRNSDGPSFYFLDGPPYVTGDLHIGGLRVKVIKDAILRFRRSFGYKVYDRAGYDVHGLPIEKKVESTLGISSKKEIVEKVGIERFIQACKDFVNSYMNRMDNDYYRYGVWLDFKDPYIPYKEEYILAGLRIFKKIYDNGYVYREKKTVPYCIYCDTTLAQGTAELEYANDTDPSIYVLFKLNPELNRNKRLSDAYLLVWTTTPWTLPDNLVIAADPEAEYLIVEFNGKKIITSKNSLDRLKDRFKEYRVLDQIYGKELNKMHYIHPLEDLIPLHKDLREQHIVIADASIVNANEGSGFVHVAPAHGIDDYNLGIRYKLKMLSNVKEDGRYTEAMGKYAGMQVFEANEIIINDLKERGALIVNEKITHSYPHCWRCHNKVIYISTDQWFFNIQKVKSKILKENRKIRWHPKEAVDWQEAVFKNAPDWCISRQRYWGIPLPIWICDSCKNVTVIGSKEELLEKAKNKEYVRSMNDLHKPYIDNVVLECDRCHNDMHRVPDVFDVWYDSSIAFNASIRDKVEEDMQVDFLIEGTDQLRGWFSGTIKIGVMLYGKTPVKNIGVTSMVLDEKGREIHKHLGNYIAVSEEVKVYPADSIRYWVFSHSYQPDVLTKKSEWVDGIKYLMLLHNIEDFIKEYSSYVDYDYKKISKKISKELLDKEDLWIMSRFNRVLNNVTDLLKDYYAPEAFMELKGFVLNDLSRDYIKLLKKRFNIEDKQKMHAKLSVLNSIFFKTLVINTPFLPFITEKIYRSLYGLKDSIHLEDWPRVSKKDIDDNLERSFSIANEIVAAILSSRDKAQIRLRWPIKAAYVTLNDEQALKVAEEMKDIIMLLVNSKQLVIKRGKGSKEVRPEFNSLGPKFKSYAPRIADLLKRANADDLESSIRENGKYIIEIDGNRFEITANDFKIIEKEPEGNAVSFKYGYADIDKELDDKLREEAFIRELQRRIQLLRKSLGLKKIDIIRVYYRADQQSKEAIERNIEELKRYVNAKELINKEDNNMQKLDLEDSEVYIKIEKL